MGYGNKSNSRKRSSGGDREAMSPIRSGFMGFGFSLACALFLWLAASAIAYANNDPDSVAGGLGLAAIYLSSFFGGFFAVKMNRKNALLSGLVCGGTLAALTLLLSIIFSLRYSSDYPLIISLGMRAAIVLFSVLGAFSGAHRKPKKRRRAGR